MSKRYALVKEHRRRTGDVYSSSIPSGHYIIYESKKRWFGGEKWVRLNPDIMHLYSRTEKEARDHIKYLLALEIDRAKPDKIIGYFK